MDSNAKQIKQCSNPTKKKSLILEARHSISIEASNKIRSKLSPRIFMPRTPIYRPQHCPKELKPNILQNKYLTKHEVRTYRKSKIKIAENFVNRIKGKYTKKLQIDKSCKIMENSNSTLNPKTKPYQNMKMLRKNNTKDIKKSLAWAIQNLENPIRITKVRNLSAKENAIKNWGNFEFIGNVESDNSKKYSMDGDIIYLDDPLALSPTTALQQDKSTNKMQSMNTITTTMKNAGHNKSVELINENSNRNSPYWQVTEQKTHRDTANSMCNSKGLQTKVDKISSQLTKESPHGTVSMEVGNKGRKISKENSNTVVLKNSLNTISHSVHTVILPNVSKNENCNSLDSYTTTNEKMKNNTNLEQQNSIIKKAENIQNKMQTNINQMAESPTVTNIRKPDIINQKNHNINEGPTPPPTIRSKANNPCSTKRFKTENSFATNPLDIYLQKATAVVAGFQHSVKSAVSSILDSSEIDKTINNDLMDLESCLENFTKYLLKSYNDIDKQELKTKNFIEYLRRKNLGQSSLVQQNRPENSCSNPSKTPTETLTIIIEADIMPAKAITFNTKDILNPTLFSHSDKTSDTSMLTLNTPAQTLTNSTSENSNKAIINSTTSENTSDMQKSNKTSARVRRKVTTKKQKPLFLNTQRQATAYPENVTTHNSNMHFNMAPNSFSFNGTSGFSNTITSQVFTNSPVAVINCFNDSVAAENINQIRMASSQIPRLHLNHSSSNFNGGPAQVPIENQNHFEYYSSFCRVPYLQNPYFQCSNTPNAYSFQMENNISNLGTTNFPIYEDIQMGNY